MKKKKKKKPKKKKKKKKAKKEKPSTSTDEESLHKGQHHEMAADAIKVVNGGELIRLAANVASSILYFLPRNVNIPELASIVEKLCDEACENSFEVVEENLNDKHKTTLVAMNI